MCQFGNSKKSLPPLKLSSHQLIQYLTTFSRKLKEKRKRIQDQNMKKKEEAKEVLKEKSLKGMKIKSDETKNVSQESQENAVEEDDDREYYRQEVGEEPDKGWL